MLAEPLIRRKHYAASSRRGRRKGSAGRRRPAAREEYDRTGSTPAAVPSALARTGRLVTCAAAILAISFASLSGNPDVVIEMIATGIGVGIIVDAVLVRTLLVPALVAIMGRWNWWLPAGLAKLLRVRPTDTWHSGQPADHPVRT